MKIYKGLYAFLMLAMVVLFMSACSPSIGGNGGSSLSPLQVLKNSAKTMQQVKSAHFQMTTTTLLQTGSATRTTGTPTPGNNISLNLTANGDENLPDQESLNLTLNSAINLAEIVQGDKVYIQNTRGQWYVLDKSALGGLADNAFAGINLLDLNSLIGLAQTATLSDHGDETLNGQSLRHITVTLDKDGFRQLISSNEQLKDLFGQQNIDAVLSSAKTLKASLDLWIDETQFYLHRVELKFNLNADLSSLNASATATASGPVLSPLTTTLDSVVDLSKFNEPVTITIPTKAIPTDNPLSILGLGQ
jgi:hypothetical protein